MGPLYRGIVDQSKSSYIIKDNKIQAVDHRGIVDQSKPAFEMKWTPNIKTMHFLPLALTLLSLTANAADKRIYSTDAIGNRQYDKPSFTVTDEGRIYETYSIGNKRYDKQSYKIEGNKIIPTDTIGNRQYNNPSFGMQTKWPLMPNVASTCPTS